MNGKLLSLRPVRGLPGEMSDEALLAACSVGDAPALGALYDRLHPHLWRFLARITGRRSVQDLDDLVQATFVAVHGAAARYRGGASVRTWVFAIAANIARRHTLGETRRQLALGRLAQIPAEQSARPDETVERRNLLDRVRAALEGLPHDLRVAFVLCDLEEIPGREAARVLEIPDGTLSRRLYDARRALRATIHRGEEGK
jgi:RNA polymerase sigma-70 factor (ECF subfamily)